MNVRAINTKGAGRHGPPVTVTGRALLPHAEALESRRLLSASLLDNVALTSDTNVQQMPSVAADPHAPQRVAVAYMDRSLVNTGYAGIGVARSDDGGQTWRYSAITLPAGYEQGAAQPIAKFDDRGRLFVSFMAATYLGALPPITNPSGFNPDTDTSFRTLGFTANTGIFVARSDDAGATWGAPVAVAAEHYDGAHPVPFETMPDLAIDTFATLPDGRANPNYGKVYVVWTRFYPQGQFPGEPDSTGGSLMQLAVSGDHGNSFAARPPIRDTYDSGTGPPPGLGNAIIPRPTVGPEGDLYVAYYDFGNYFVFHSDDAGETFGTPDVGRLEYVVFEANGAAGANTAAGPGNAFRTQVNRQIVADPSRPGVVYAAEPVVVVDEHGNEIDSGDVRFARSEDYGRHWAFRGAFTVGGRPADTLNDDNFGQVVRAGGTDDVAARQFFSRIAIDARGNLAAIWCDTRRDPANVKLDVFGTVSTDGGRSFSPNFRITGQTFDANAGAFIDPRGEQNFYLGDLIGLSVVDGAVYTAWTDTRDGNQDVFFSRFDLTPSPPDASNDRFEPNDEPSEATVLGPLVGRVLPKLTIGAAEGDVFSFETLATGTLVIRADRTSGSAGSIKLELLDAAGANVLAESTPAAGAAGAVQLVAPSRSGQQFLLRVSAAKAGSGMGTGYSLDIRSLTGDLGTIVHDAVSGSIAAGDADYFALAAAASGTLKARLAPSGGAAGALSLQLLDPITLEPLGVLPGSSAEEALVPVRRGLPILARVAAADDSPLAEGAFSVEFTNLDEFASADRSSLLFPAGDGPSQVEAGDMNGDGLEDLVVTNAFTDTVSVLLASGDGTFQSPRQFAVGAFVAGSPDKLIPLNTFRRDLVLADFDRDGNLDAAVANTDSADVSVLLGRGDGTLQPQRRFDAVTRPFAIDAGDLNADGVPDLAVMDVLSGGLAILLGRGDGTFRNQFILQTGLSLTAGNSTADVKIADVNGDGRGDLVYTGAKDQQTYVRLGAGDGTTYEPASSFRGGGPEVQLADLDGDGDLDAVNATFYNNKVSYAFNDGSGTFGGGGKFDGGQAPVGVAVADLGSAVPGDEEGDAPTLGPPDGIPDIISAASGTPLTSFHGPPAIMVSPGMLDEKTGARVYGDALPLTTDVALPLSITLADVDGNGAREVAFVDSDGVRLVSSRQQSLAPNTTRETARQLGTVVHLLQPTLTIVPDFADAWYTLTAPNEAARGSGDEVIDIAGLFATQSGAGLGMEVLDAAGNVIATGEHARVRVGQGQTLYVHIFGQTGPDGSRGAGAYTLDVTVLPQLVSVESQYLLPAADARPAGPVTSLVLTFQGDRLNPASAEDPANYRVTYLGADGKVGGNDDRLIALPDSVAQPAVYNPSANVDVSTGLQYPTAVRQTVTLLFDRPLPPGAYRVEVAPAVAAADFNQAEAALLGVVRHPVVTARENIVAEGADRVVAGLVPRRPRNAAVDLPEFRAGTPYLSQLHGDLSALLDQRLSAAGDRAAITPELLRQLLGRLRAGLPAGGSMLALFLDPVGIDFADPGGARLNYDLQSVTFDNQIPNAFVSVAGNVELVIVPFAEGRFTLNVDDVPATARGGAVILDGQVRDGGEAVSLTERLRAGERTFEFDVEPLAAPGPAPADPLVVFASLTSTAPAQSSTAFTVAEQAGTIDRALSQGSPAATATGGSGILPRRNRDAPQGQPSPLWWLLDGLKRLAGRVWQWAQASKEYFRRLNLPDDARTRREEPPAVPPAKKAAGGEATAPRAQVRPARFERQYESSGGGLPRGDADRAATVRGRAGAVTPPTPSGHSGITPAGAAATGCLCRRGRSRRGRRKRGSA